MNFGQRKGPDQVHRYRTCSTGPILFINEDFKERELKGAPLQHLLVIFRAYIHFLFSYFPMSRCYFLKTHEIVWPAPYRN